MTAKEYLKQLQTLDIKIGQKQQELESLKLNLSDGGISGIRYDLDRVQSSVDGDPAYVKLIQKIVDLCADINADIDRFVDLKDLMINQIQGLTDSRFIDLLYKRYVQYKSLELIAVEMKYDYTHVRKLHGYALQSFDRMYKISDGYTKLHFSVR